MSKRCTKCLEWKPISDFHRDRTKRDGLKAQCRACQNESKREYRARPDVKARQRTRSRTHPRLGAVRLLPGRITPIAFRRWRAQNRERKQAHLQAHLRKWHAQNRKASYEWRKENHETIQAGRQRYRALLVEAPINSLDPAQWLWLLEQYDHHCAYCGQSTEQLGEKLTPDHVVPLSKGGNNCLSNIVPACATCNSRKGARTPQEAGMTFARHVNLAEVVEQLDLL